MHRHTTHTHTHTHTRTHAHTHTHTHTHILSPSSSTSHSFVPEPALLEGADTPLSPHHEAKQKVKENVWEMNFSENGR